MTVQRLLVSGLASAIVFIGVVAPAVAQTAPPSNEHTCLAVLTAPQTSGLPPGFVGQLASEQAKEGANAQGARGEQVRGFTGMFANCGITP